MNPLSHRIEILEARIAPATFVVNSFDAVPSSTADGKLTLIEAVTAATTNQAFGDAKAGDALADTITFAPALAGKTIQLTAPLVINSGGQLSITGPGTSVGSIILSAASNARVLTDGDTVDAVLLSHLTIENGNQGSGGGIFNGGSLYLDDVLVTKNTAGSGGGITNSGSAAKLSIVHSRIEENTSTFTGSGGGILNTNGGQLTIRETTIASNFCWEGGGLFNDSTSTVAISASKITGNHGDSSGDGAGLRNNGTMTIDETTVSGNVGLGSSYFGGGIRNDGTLTIRNSTISGNVSQGHGGGISADVGTLTIINSTIANNTALGSSGGGGIFTSGTTTISFSTIVGNLDGSGSSGGAGGIEVSGGNTPLLQGTIVAGNFVRTGSSADVMGTFNASSGFNFIGIGDGGNLTNGANNNHVGTSSAPLDAKLGPLQNNGGRTFTMVPLIGSPVIDRGGSSDSFPADPFGAILFTDQRGPGFTRVTDGDGNQQSFPDIGAVEAPTIPVEVVTGVTSLIYNDPSGSGNRLSVTLTGGGTFDLFRVGEAAFGLEAIETLIITGATPASALTVKVLQFGSNHFSSVIDSIRSDAGLKSITFGKGVEFDGTMSIDGALGSLALDTMSDGAFIRTGGTAKQTMKISANGDFTAVIDTTSALGNLSIPKFNFTGAIRAAAIGNISALAFGGRTLDDTFNLGSNGSQDLIATSGPIGKLTTANGAVQLYDIQAGPGPLGTFGGISVTNKSGIFGIDQTTVNAAQIGAISVKMSSLANPADPLRGIGNSSFLATNGSIASVAVSTNFTFLPNNPSSFGIKSSGFTAATGIGNVTVTATKFPSFGTIASSGFFAGTATLPTWESLATAKLQAAALKSSSLGAIQATGAIATSNFVSAGNIGAVTAPLGLSNSNILAGASLGADRAVGGTGANADFFVRPVSIGAITMKQPVNVTIAAGIIPGTTTFGSGGDAAADAGKIGGTSKIGAIKIIASFSTTTNTSANTHTSAIEAGAIALLKVNATVVVPSTGSGILLDNDGVAGDSPGDTFIRLL